jgi:hypothetical protein
MSSSIAQPFGEFIIFVYTISKNKTKPSANQQMAQIIHTFFIPAVRFDLTLPLAEERLFSTPI